ncbi:hypothetical protein [Janthinobacterium sp. RB2R34]|uniref:hypothetical protein n=1 Tax=Janthinobacterium sp. RB2R34 TaxID=3424193 RepID=UPI003F1EEB2E
MKPQMARHIIPKIISIVLLTGCASAPQTPVRVEVPVLVPCIGEVPQRPVYEFDKLPSTATDGEIVLALARDWARSRTYEQTLQATISGCVDKQHPG